MRYKEYTKRVIARLLFGKPLPKVGRFTLGKPLPQVGRFKIQTGYSNISCFICKGAKNERKRIIKILSGIIKISNNKFASNKYLWYHIEE